LYLRPAGRKRAAGVGDLELTTGDWSEPPDMTDKVVVLVTCRKAAEARRIGRVLVEARLAACANVLEAPVQSVYRWKGKVETTGECLVVIKTSRRLFPALQAQIERLHSYEVPEVIALPILAGSRRYLRWLEECLLRPSSRPRRGEGKRLARRGAKKK
jgi:periplasmic divalent cation tolerance protein